MHQIRFKYTLILFLSFIFLNCKGQVSTDNPKIKTENTKELIKLNSEKEENPIVLGAARFEEYLPLLKDKKVGVVTNQTGIVWQTDTQQHYDTIDIKVYVVDKLLQKGINVQRIFAPEHGFRGKADAGEVVKDGKDVKTGLPIISLYGKNKKPYNSQVSDLDVIVFDIQDVGARFYTYISTLHYVMEAAAENGVKVIVLDRPNPNAHYIDGPILEPAQKSFVGMHPVPIVYGMTIGEYAQMINGEHWLKNGVECDLTVVSLLGYTHDSEYSLPVKPSPNLPNDSSINLYPSLCFFEGTQVSVGRGTDMQFQVYGLPDFDKNKFSFSFKPQPNEGAKLPKHNGKMCYGKDLRKEEKQSEINLKWLLNAYQQNPGAGFFNKNLFFDKLAGTSQLRKQILAGKTEAEIKATWQKGLEDFKKTRAKYLLYEQ